MWLFALMHCRENAVDALEKLVAVGKTSEIVVFGKMRDSLLRALAFGHVLRMTTEPPRTSFSERRR